MNPAKIPRPNLKKHCTQLNFLSNELSKIDSNDILCEQGQESLATIIYFFISTAKIDLDKVAAEFAEESALQEKISDWIKINGDISPEFCRT